MARDWRQLISLDNNSQRHALKNENLTEEQHLITTSNKGMLENIVLKITNLEVKRW